MSERFYINCPLAPGPVVLEGPEAHHLTAVCRLRPGDAVCLFNGDGREYPALVHTILRRAVTLEVTAVQSTERELPFPLEIAVPLPRGDRAQFLVEKLTEIGATTYVPLLTQRSVVQPRETKIDKLERYVIEASKQCGRNVLMNIAPVARWEDHARQPWAGLRLLTHPHSAAAESACQVLASLAAGAERPPLRLVVGPEGGFTDEEVALAQEAGWQIVHLGRRILRVETAALVLAAWASGNF
jgi:16S rRNA (uracil1498-N3)-methyltransferase